MYFLEEKITIWVWKTDLIPNVPAPARPNSCPAKTRPWSASRSQLRGRDSRSVSLIDLILTVNWHFYILDHDFSKNLLACNILMSDMAGMFTLQNHGQARNCSLTTLLFPANFELHSLAVGAATGRQRRALSSAGSGLSTNCDPDFVQLGGSSELDSSHLVTSQTLCGEQYRPGKGLTVLCGSSTVRYGSYGS